MAAPTDPAISAAIPGDPETLLAGARTFAAAADTARSTASQLAGVTAAVHSPAVWTGTAANTFASDMDRLVGEIEDASSGLDTAAGALNAYAEHLAAGQATLAGAVAGAVTARADNVAALLRIEATPLPADPVNAIAAKLEREAARQQAADTLRTALDGANRRASAAEEDVLRAAAAAAEAIHGVLSTEGKSFLELVDWVNNWVLGAPMTGWGIASTIPAAIAGRNLLAAHLALDRSRAAIDAEFLTKWSEEVNSVALAFDRGEATLADVEAAAQRVTDLRAIANLFMNGEYSQAAHAFAAGGLPDTPLFKGLGYGTGGLAVIGDAMTVWRPPDSGAVGALDRGMAVANAGGTVAAFAPDSGGVGALDRVMAVANAGGTVAAFAPDSLLLALNATDEIPVWGEGVALVTGLYLTGDWIYSNRDAIAHGAGVAWNWVSDEAQQVGGDIASGAEHVGGAIVSGAESLGGDIAGGAGDVLHAVGL